MRLFPWVTLRIAIVGFIALPMLMVGCTCSHKTPPPPPDATEPAPPVGEEVMPGETLPTDEALPVNPDETSPDEIPPSDILPENPE